MKNVFLILLILSFSILSGCTPMSATRGNLLEDYQVKEILPGVDGKDDVIRKIGSPTTVSTFDDNTWYYMGQKTKKKGIMDPKVVSEKIVIISFAPTTGKVLNIQEQKDARQDIPLVQRTTPVSGNDFTFVQQMLGNVGKFNRPDEGVIATSGNR
ncbi:MAG: outer membrane protein assembly factor BamE [Alphaproteobacteria bacterium]|nr:outer membrane protein assembly factor BamE [Alphaproteobacteria bacterium]